MRLFGGSESRSSAAKVSPRIPRASSGWTSLLKTLREREGLRILDIGPTSSSNINFLTGLGHSIYMSDVVGEVSDSRWSTAADEPFPADAFLAENLEFNGRQFDVILLWDALDYLDPVLRGRVVERLHSVLTTGGQLLAFFHIKPEAETSRYHLREDGQVDVQRTGDLPVQVALNNRQIETLFRDFASYKFFLAKDNLREVIVTQ